MLGFGVNATIPSSTSRLPPTPHHLSWSGVTTRRHDCWVESGPLLTARTALGGSVGPQGEMLLTISAL